MTNEEMDRDLEECRAYLGCTRLTVERCRHESAETTAIWIFDGADKYGPRQIASVSRLETPYERSGNMYRWRANTYANGSCANGVFVATLLDALGHVMRCTKGQ
jgi:hypothetical protein